MNNTVNNSKAFRNENGSILMETVIVIPLFMLLIGGIMWSGQLIYAKQRLVVADRYVAWNAGNRHAQNYSDVQSQFFNQSIPDASTTPPPKEISSSPWWHVVHGSVGLIATMPVWTKGWFYPSYDLRQASQIGSGGGVPELAGLHGRDLSGGVSGGHTVVMRHTLTDSRAASVNPNDDVLGVKNNSIYSENWPFQ